MINLSPATAGGRCGCAVWGIKMSRLLRRDEIKNKTNSRDFPVADTRPEICYGFVCDSGKSRLLRGGIFDLLGKNAVFIKANSLGFPAADAMSKYYYGSVCDSGKSRLLGWECLS